MRNFNLEFAFNSKTGAILTAICVLASVFIPVANLEASNSSLNITKSVDKRFALPGEEIVYTLNYQNTGQGTATGVIIKDPFINQNQHYLSFISATPTPNSGNDTWIIDSLDPGQAGQITIRAKISSAIYSGSLEIRNRASIDSNETSLKNSNSVSAFVSVRPAIKITKSVRNVSTNSSFAQVVGADPGETVEFLIGIDSFADGKVNNVRVWDDLSKGLNYISGSTKVNDSSYSDGITTGGINLGAVMAGERKTIKFQAKLSSESDFEPGTTVLDNYAYAEADNIYTIYNSAVVVIEIEIEIEKTIPTISTYSTSTSTGLSVSKQARNITTGSTYWQSWTDLIYAGPGDEIEFLIKIKSGSKQIDSVRVSDKLPPKLTYISDSTTVDGYYEPDGITTKNVYIGDVYGYYGKEIKFKVKIASADKFSSYPIDLVNIAYVWGSDGKKIEDSTKIIVREPKSSLVKGVSISLTEPLSIIKSGRNISQKQTSWLNSFSASPGEEVEFSIQVSNTSNNDLTNVKVWDTLPAHLLLIKNSTTIDGINWGGDVAGSGLNLGTLRKNQTKIIKFRAEIASADKFSAGSTTLINTAYASADNVSQISDPASVNVKKTGEVKGAVTVVTGANLIGLVVLAIISCFLAFLIYCRLREDKLLEVLNGKGNKVFKSLARIYFKLRLIIARRSS